MTIFEGYGAVRQGVNDGRRDALAGLMVAGEYNRIYDERNMAAIMKAAPKPKAAPALIHGATPDIPGQPTAGLPTGDPVGIGGVQGPYDLPPAMNKFTTQKTKNPHTLAMNPNAQKVKNPYASAMNEFMNPIAQKVKNPYALATIAAYGQHESGYTPENIAGQWSDPSQKGAAGQSGGVMSWRDGGGSKRLSAMRNFVALNGGDPNNPSAALQGQFMLAENPQLIEKLNAATSLEEANKLMADAWRFAGFDQPGGEYQARLDTSQSLLAQFSGAIEEASSTSDASFDGTPAAGAKEQLQAGLLTQKQGMTNTVDRTQKIVGSLMQQSRDEPIFENTILPGVTEFITTNNPKINTITEWYASDAAKQYFEYNPDALSAAEADPMGFYDANIGPGAVGVSERFDGEKLSPEQVAAKQTKAAEQAAKKAAEQAAKKAEEIQLADVSKGAKEAFKRPPQEVSFELEQARGRVDNMKRIAEQQYASLIAQREAAVYQANAAQHTGSTALRAGALTQIADIDAQIIKLNAGLQSTTEAVSAEVVKLEATTAVRNVMTARDPRRLAQLWMHIGGLTNIDIVPTADGKFEVSFMDSNGQRQSSVVTAGQLVTEFWSDISSTQRTATAVTAAERAGKKYESDLKIAEEQAGAESDLKADLFKKQLELKGLSPQKLDNGMVIWSDGQLFYEYNPEPQPNEDGVTPNELKVSKTPIAGI